MEEDLENMDAFLALSNETEKNILASLAAKESGVKKTISQVERLAGIPVFSSNFSLVCSVLHILHSSR